MQSRRITTFVGLTIAMIALAALAWGSWNARASYPTGAPAANNSTYADPALAAPELAGIPLRGEWWLTQTGVHFNPSTKVSYKLEAQQAADASAPIGFMIYLKAQADTANTVSGWADKGSYVLDLLERTKDATQSRVMQEVARQQSLGNVTGKVSQFTIINAIFVHGNSEAAQAFGRLNEVAYVEADHRYYLQGDSANMTDETAQASPATIELGVNTVHAPQVWALGYKGDGIVVGSIDTGVDYLHPALNRQYRGNLGGGNYDHNYNWWDTRADATPSPVPYDDDSHGTHTTGTVMGDDGDPGTNQIGVAPHAKWIATKVFPNGGSSGNEEITPAEDFMIAPWDLNGQNRRPDLRPNIVTNSWGDDECWNTDSWLITQVWIDSGIMPSFANGNAGPTVGSVGSPGGYPFLIGVGAISASNMTIAGFSSRGPSCYGGVLKPDVVAPGVNVRSSIAGGGYASYQGTSMATPHNSGVMALILDANPSLNYTDVMGILTRTAFFSSTWGVRPNNNYGWGLVQADAAVNMALHGPHVSGTVSGPSQSARVTARRTDGDTYSVQTHAGGVYSMTVLAGTYDVEVSAFGYQTATLSAQNWLTDTSPVVNVTLSPLSTSSVSGQFLLNGACTVLSGTLSIEPGDGSVLHTTGSYSVNLPAGTYTMTADAGAAYEPIVEVVNVSGAMTHNFTFGAAHDGTYVVDTPAYNWITASGTPLAFTDHTGPNFEDGASAVTIPFAFDFYTGTYTTMQVSSNGFLTFNDATYGRMWANNNIPNPGPTSDNANFKYANNGIYPYWDDLAAAPRAYGDVYASVSGSAPNRIFVVEWRGVAGAGNPITFEVQLEETTNRFTIVYQDLDGAYGYGYSATAGAENASGTDAIQLAFNQPGRLGNMTAFRFTEAAAPVITPCAGATATPTSQVTVTPTACTLEFADVLPGNTFYSFVHCLACQGIINGYPCGGDGEPCNSNNDPYFRPSNNISRGQLSKVVSISAGYNEPITTQSFEDVAQGTTFFDYVGRLALHEVMGGYPCGVDPNEPCGNGNLPYFRPSANATRGQLTKIVSNAAGFTDPDPSTFTFTDVPPGSTFHLYVERLLINRPGVMNGYPCSAPAEPCDDQNRPYFRPSATLTRGQTSKIISNTFFPSCAVR